MLFEYKRDMYGVDGEWFLRSRFYSSKPGALWIEGFFLSCLSYRLSSVMRKTTLSFAGHGLAEKTGSTPWKMHIAIYSSHEWAVSS